MANGDKKREEEREKEAILRQLTILEQIRRRHEWTVVGHRDAEAVDREAAELDSDVGELESEAVQPPDYKKELDYQSEAE